MSDELYLPNSEVAATDSMHESPEPLGSEIGPYKLLQVLGEGGMGTVYMAQQEKPVRRRVALKIIKPGMDSKQVVARFEVERQALSMMQHPNIAQALDVGTTDIGRPYFVMELVKGLPITRYCDEKRLTINRRLQLFRSICHAVQHAHQKGIIHRDLKPSNILVAEYDKQAVPKIIDFGLAKALHHQLTDQTVFTQLGQVVGTFEYMSPEQSKMNELDVDTRTDIYALGVLLYELLTGTVPFDKKRLRSAAIDQLLKIIREEEPPKPSTRLSTVESSAEIAANRGLEPKRMSLLLRGDLDWIVMKAIEKDRDRRYESANGLGMDVQRYIDGEPVTAAPPSTRYRLKKFAQRNRVAVAVSLLVTSALVTAVVGTSIGMAWAFVEKVRANRQTQLAKTAQKDAELAREESEYSQYVSNIPAANSFLNDYSRVLAQSLLKQAPAEHRNFEWAFLANRAWPPTQFGDVPENSVNAKDANIADYWSNGDALLVREFIPREVSGGLHSCFFSSDGKSVFFNLANGGIKRFSISTGEPTGHYSIATGIAIHPAQSPDGALLSSFTFSNRATIWNIESEEVVKSRSQELDKGGAWICDWSPDQKFLVTSHMGGDLQIWDADSLAPLNECVGHQKGAMNLYFPPDSKTFWSASSDGTVRQWSIPEGEPLSTFQIPTVKNLEYQAISPSGELAFAMGLDGSHFIWRIRDEEIIQSLSEGDGETYLGQPRISCSFSHDESCVAVITGRTRVSVYDCRQGDILNELTVRGHPLMAVELSPDGKMLMTASQATHATIWTCMLDDSPNLSKAHDDIIYQMDMDSKGRHLLIGSFDLKASIWDLRDRRRQTVYAGHAAEIVAVDLHPDGSRAATLDARGNLHVWDASNAEPVFEIKPESDEFAKHIGRSGGALRANVLNFPAVLSTGLFTPDGSRIVVFQKDAMKVFDARDREELAVLDGALSSGWAVYNYDSSLVAVLEMNAEVIRVWDIMTGDLVNTLKGHDTRLVMLNFSPIDDRIVSSAMGGTVIIWDARSGKHLHVLEATTGNAASCRFSADGRRVLVGYTDSTARVWDSFTGKLVATLIGHSNWIRDVRLNPDQSRILSWGTDNKAMIWDVAQPLANQLVVQGSDSQLLQAHWTPDGRDIVTAWSDGSIEIWHGATRKDVAHLADVTSDQLGKEFDQWRMNFMNTNVRR